MALLSTQLTIYGFKLEDLPEKKKKPGSLRNYARYSAIGFQMLAIIGGLTWLGVKMDEWLEAEPVFTIILSLSSVGIALYAVIKQLKS